MFGAMPRLCWNSSKRLSPNRASRMISMLHHSPTRSRLRAIGHGMLRKLLCCMPPKYPVTIIMQVTRTAISRRQGRIVCMANAITSEEHVQVASSDIASYGGDPHSPRLRALSGEGIFGTWLPPKLPPRLVSLRLAAGGRDNRPPRLDLGFVKCSKRLRRLLVTRRNFEPEIAQATAHSRVSHRIHSGGIEGSDDSFRSAVRYPQRVP